jgi:hypothetical protein
MSNRTIVKIIVGLAVVLVWLLLGLTGNGDVFGVFVLWALWIGAYFVPMFIAVQRKIRLQGAVVVVNVFLGWTFIGWVVALAMAVSGTRNSAVVAQ